MTGILEWFGWSSHAPKKSEVRDASANLRKAICEAEEAHNVLLSQQIDEDKTTRVLRLASSALTAVTKSKANGK